MKNSNQKGSAKNNATAKNAAANAAQENINVMVFERPEFGPIRAIMGEDKVPLFCGKDVCEALGYAKTDKAVREHVSNLDVLKRYLKVPGSFRKDGTRTMRSQMMLFVNESGVYSLVFGSKLESAQRFKHWVTSEVLPAIRKNGGYFHINPGETPEQMKARFQKMLDEALAERNEMIRQKDELLRQSEVVLSKNKALIAEQDERIRDLDKTVDEQMVRLQRSAEEILGLEGDIDRMMPKALYTDNVLDSISCYTTTQIAKELGCTAQELNRSLCAMHIQYYQSGQYMLYAQYAHMGLAKSRTRYKAVMEPRCLNAVQMVAGEEPMPKVGRVYTHTYLVWTERGRKFIHDQARRLMNLAESINK